MDVTASAYHIRVAPRKMDLLVKTIKNLLPKTAAMTLAHLNKSGSSPLRKVIESALANAQNKKIDTESITFKKIEVLQGPSMKRFHAVSRGMAHGYKKRMSHIKITLTDAPVKKEAAHVKKVKSEVKIEKNSKSEIPNSKQFDKLTILSNVEGQIQNTNT